MERINKLAALCTLAFLSATLGAVRAQAQDTSSAPAAPAPSTPSEPGAAPPAEPGPPSSPGVVAPADSSSPSAPASPAPTSPAPDGAPSGAAPPSAAPPPTGSATFEPLLDEPPTRPKKPQVSAPAAPAPASAPPEAPAEPSTYHPSVPHSDPVPPPDSDKANDDEGLFGPFRIGFLVGGGLPDLLTLGGMIKLTRYFGAGVNVGLIPTVKISLYGDATVAFQEYDLYGHIFPFGGAFFMGAGVGYANVHGTLATRYPLTAEQVAIASAAATAATHQPIVVTSPLEIDSVANVRTLVLTPQIGLLKTFQAGFSIGIDVGAQIPIAPSKVDFSTSVPPGIPQSLVTPNDNKVRSTLDSIGRTVLPTVGVKLGWLL
ncbi:MAG TPA: hypothetical protein VGF76_26250 [Polyangiaceae bacterium]